MMGKQKNTNCQLIASKDALKVIYYVIIGIAITQALDRVFLENGAFIGMKVFKNINILTHFLLLIAFLPTICRFVHGASIHLNLIHTGTFKTLIDFIGFFLQAILFYLMAIAIDNIVVFAILFCLMLSIDAIWLVLLCTIGYQNFKGTVRQWIFSDVILIFILIVCIIYFSKISSMLTAIIILLASLVATFFDYIQNRNFYFPGHE